MNSLCNRYRNLICTQRYFEAPLVELAHSRALDRVGGVVPICQVETENNRIFLIQMLIGSIPTKTKCDNAINRIESYNNIIIYPCSTP